MSRLEKDKQKLQLSDTDQQHCETFAQLIFNRAEKLDQAGRWDQNTVIAYYSASYFIEVQLLSALLVSSPCQPVHQVMCKPGCNLRA